MISCYSAFVMHFLSDDANETAQVEGSDVLAADVVLYGLNIIVPLMTVELLKVILVYVCFLLHGMLYTFDFSIMT